MTLGLTASGGVRAYLEWGTRIALANSAPGADVVEQAPVPRWGWGAAPPWTD